jgi:hypothetical protein
VVEAMIGQINEDLQIHSPSAVMAQIGQQMMAGLSQGVAMMAPALSAQLSASVAGPISPLMAGAMGAGSSTSTTNNYNFPMTVHTAATAPAVIRQYDVRRSMMVT